MTTLLVSLQTKIYAQAGFTTAVQSQYNLGTAFVRSTGNDIVFENVNNFTFAVSVWDDGASTSPALGYEIVTTSANAGTVALTYVDAIDPDVCLVIDNQDPDKIYAMVVYWSEDAGNKWILDVFNYFAGSNSFVYHSDYTIASGYYNTSINIDGNANGEFAIVYDDLSSNLWAIVGDVNGGAVNFNPAILVDLTNTTSNLGVAPDVAMYYDGSYNRVYFTYVEPNSGEIWVEYDDYSNLTGGSYSQNVDHIEPPSSGQFLIPRIACPNASAGNDYWTVAAEFRDAGNYYIISVINDNGSIFSQLVNDGSLGNLDISADMNIHPAVCYDVTSNIWIGWSYDHIGTFLGGWGASAVAFYPLAIKLDINGNLITTKYMEVPTTISTSDYWDLLSLAGRHTSGLDDVYLTYMLDGNSDVYTKQVNYGVGGLRNMNNTNNDIKNILKENINHKAVYYKMYDMHGRLKASGSYNSTKINQNSGLSTGIYLLKLFDSDYSQLSVSKVDFINN